jgi:hypothetical protein
MKRRIALLCLVAAPFVGVSAAPTSSASLSAPTAVVKSCGAGYTHANLSWGEKCLRAGQFCKVGNREYLRYGFSCPSSGHLRRR